jgi:S-DNA-T family DNA segregation ATPase FtsK/SpoIIIE
LLGAKQLTEEPKLWVQAASSGTGLPDEQKAVWEAALRGLAASDDWTLPTAAYRAPGGPAK